MKKAFISGITGQDGSWLSSILALENYEIYGGVRDLKKIESWRLEYLNLKDKIEFVYFDLNDLDSIEKAIKEIKPDEFYNFAAKSSVADSFQDPILVMQNVGLSVTKILDSIFKFSKDTKFFQASSAEIYANQIGIVDENSCPMPNSPYGISKNYANEMVKMYRSVYGIFAVNGIFFSHESELRGENFFTKKVARHVSNLNKNNLSILEVGNIETKRDFGYAKEYMEAVLLSMRKEKSDDYIISTGVKTSLVEFISYSFKQVGFEIIWSGEKESLVGLDKNSNQILVKINKKFYRPSELCDFTSSNEKVKKNLNWKPEFDYKKISDLMIRFEKRFGT